LESLGFDGLAVEVVKIRVWEEVDSLGGVDVSYHHHQVEVGFFVVAVDHHVNIFCSCSNESVFDVVDELNEEFGGVVVDVDGSVVGVGQLCSGSVVLGGAVIYC